MKILFRVDASTAMGGGHWLRCLILADALLAQGHSVHWCYAQTTPALLQRVQQREIGPIPLAVEMAQREDAEMTRCQATADDVDWLILDGYQFGADYREALSQTAPFNVLLIDDLNDSGPLFADAVLNTNLYADRLEYPRLDAASGRTTDLLLGPEYVLLPSAYQRVSPPDLEDRHYLFVNFGASDAAGLTLPTLQRLAEVGFAGEVCVVTGPAMSDHAEVARRCRQYGFIHKHDLADLRDVLAQSRMALTAAGSTLNELAFMGVPAVFLVVADNQLCSANCHQARGWCVWHDGRTEQGLRDAVTDTMLWWEDCAQLAERSQRARRLIDGRGAERIVAYLQQRR